MDTTTKAIATDTIHLLQDKLIAFLSQWRRTGDEEALHHYQSVLRCMVELGLTRELSIDMELPDRYLPKEYLELFD